MTKRLTYGCNAAAEAFVLPATATVGLSVYDFDGGPNGEYTEQLTTGNYAYFRTPLRSSSGNIVASTIAVDRSTGTFTSLAHGTRADNPSDPLTLSDTQASRAVQLFYRPQLGYIDATFAVTYTGDGDGTGRNLLFGGDANLCDPPPPMPPSWPPPPSPPTSPPLPPTPPAPAVPGEVYVQTVTVSFTIAGSVETFDRQAFETNMRALFPAALEVCPGYYHSWQRRFPFAGPCHVRSLSPPFSCPRALLPFDCR